MKDVQISGEDITIRDIESVDGNVHSTIVSNTIIYFVSYTSKKKLYKHKLENNETQEYPYNDFVSCTSIRYNQSINRVIVTVSSKGVYWFEPGKEDQIKKYNNFPTNLSGNIKFGMIFNETQGILKNWTSIYYSPNLLEETAPIKLNIQYSNVYEVVFIDEKYAAVIFHENRKLIIIDLEQNIKVSEIVLHESGYASSMSIDKDTKRLIIGVRDNHAWSTTSSWGYIH